MIARPALHCRASGLNRHLLRYALLGAVIFPGSALAALALNRETTMPFASADEGRKILTGRDDFMTRLSAFDRSARMKVDHTVSEEEFRAFVGKNVRDWTEAEQQTVRNAIDKLRPLLARFALSFPPTIELVRTTGAEEGNAAYTRANAIVLPPAELARSEPELERLICHELFHILSRRNPALREKLYAAIGFRKCDEIALPPSLEPRKITNPDAPRNDHFIRLASGGHPIMAVPILLSTAAAYDRERGGEFFDYLSFQFLVVTPGITPESVVPLVENSAPKLLQPQEVNGFFEQVGKNTNYIIHPEEILADNFALLVLGKEDVPSPEILQKMRAILARRPPA